MVLERFDKTSGFEILLILFICIFVFSTTLLNVIYLDNDEDQSNTIVLVFSYILVASFGVAILLFSFVGAVKFKNNTDIFGSSSNASPVTRIFGFDDGASTALFMIIPAVLLSYSAVMLSYMLEHKKENDSCEHSHQYLFVSTIILLTLSSILFLPLFLVGGYNAIEWTFGKNKSSSKYSYSSYSPLLD